MKRYILIATLSLAAILTAGTMTEAYSQSLLERVGKAAVKRAKNKAIEKVEKKVEKVVDKAVDKAVDAAVNKTEEVVTEIVAGDSVLVEINENLERQEAEIAERKAAEKERQIKEMEARRKEIEAQFAGRAASKEGPFFISKEGVVLTYANKNIDGDIDSYAETTVMEVERTDDRNFTVESATLLLDADREPLMSLPISSMAVVKDGIASFNPESMAGMMTAGMEISGDYFFVPDNIIVGDTLPDYKMNVTIGAIRTVSEYTDVKVTERETIKISGKSIDCYIIESETTSQVLGIKSKIKQKVWYGRGVGQVKTETYDALNRRQSSYELVGIKGL